MALHLIKDCLLTLAPGPLMILSQDKTVNDHIKTSATRLTLNSQSMYLPSSPGHKPPHMVIYLYSVYPKQTTSIFRPGTISNLLDVICLWFLTLCSIYIYWTKMITHNLAKEFIEYQPHAELLSTRNPKMKKIIQQIFTVTMCSSTFRSLFLYASQESKGN